MRQNESDHIRISNFRFLKSKEERETEDIMTLGEDEATDQKIFDEADRILDTLGISKKDTLRMKLLFEESICMLRSLTVYYDADIRFEKATNTCNLRIMADAHINATMKQELIDVSSSKKNSAVRGIMDKIADAIDDALLRYDDVLKIQNQYAGTAPVGLVGMCGNVESGMMWSLNDYRGAVAETYEEEAEESDELEKSIIANLAKEVKVGVKGSKIEMLLIYALSS